MKYRKLEQNEIDIELFRHFERRQTVTKCWRKIGGQWVIQDAPFIDQWGEDDYAELVACLIHTLQTGGVVFAAFRGEALKGFASVEPVLFGSRNEYLDLSSLHVSEDMRRQGVGRKLFHLAAGWAKEKGAEKLYISGHSAVETQAFYRMVGCVEAVEYQQEHVEKEPFDCQLEYRL